MVSSTICAAVARPARARKERTCSFEADIVKLQAGTGLGLVGLRPKVASSQQVALLGVLMT